MKGRSVKQFCDAAHKLSRKLKDKLIDHTSTSAIMSHVLINRLITIRACDEYYHHDLTGRAYRRKVSSLPPRWRSLASMASMPPRAISSRWRGQKYVAITYYFRLKRDFIPACAQWIRFSLAKNSCPHAEKAERLRLGQPSPLTGDAIRELGSARLQEHDWRAADAGRHR